HNRRVKGARLGAPSGLSVGTLSTGRLVEQHRPSGSDLARVIAEVAEADPSEPWIKEIAAGLSRGGRQTAADESPLEWPAGRKTQKQKPCRVRKSIRHAARAYSWMSPPSRSRRWSWSGGFELTEHGLGIGGVSARARCGLWVL